MTKMAKLKEKIIYKDIDRKVVKDDKIVNDTISEKLQKRIIRQIEKEYMLCFSYNEAKRKVNLARIKLYNNQRRDPGAVGDNLMFTVFNTIHSELYDDRLMAQWEGRGGQGDEDVESNLNALAEFDYDIMGKNKLDYEWNWDAEFFGRGLILMMDFERSKGIMAPVPEVVDAVTWIRDPRANSVNGDMRGKGGMRFGGREVGATYYELKALSGYFNIGALKKDKEVNSTIDEARSARREAQNLENFSQKEEDLGKHDNYEFRLLDWFTTIQGKKYLVTLGNSRSVVIRLTKLDYGNLWPINDRALYPMAHDWDGVSIPDLTEDKQRARAVLTNIGLQSAKDDVTPSYLFDQTVIKNKNDLNFRIRKFIGVDGRVDRAIQPIQKSTAHQYVSIIMDMLDTSAQRATAATELRQGIQPSKQSTLGEQEMAMVAGSKRFNMSAKVYGWSEKDFWRQWYRQYKKHFKEKIDEKIIRIQGAMAPVWRPLTRENIISQIDPDVKIESMVISESKRIREQASYANFAALALQDPDNNRRFIQRRMGKLQGMSKEELDLTFPPTVDELQAEDENQLINANKMPSISINDDHLAHLEIHAKANQNSYSLAHTRAHKRLMITKRNRPDLFAPPEAPQFQTQGQAQGPGQPKETNAEKMQPARVAQ